MSRRAQTTAEKMIKVDHAGENGAVNIYRGQQISARLFNRRLLPELSEFQSHEEEHRRIFAGFLADNNIRRCISYHGCGTGGLALGLITGLLGAKAIAATTYAVEHVVLAHLDEQMQFLKSDSEAAFRAVEQIYADEMQHHDSAHDKMDHTDLMTRILVRIVSLSTEAVIRIGMR